MQAVTAIDDHKAELAALRAGSESAHAAQRHAETELSQYMAWYAMAEHQHLHEQRRAEKAEAELSRSTELLESCRGQNGSLIEQNKRLRAWGEEAPHKQHCPWHFWQDENKCTCGKRAALAQEAEG